MLISTWERGIRVQFEFRFGRSCRGGGSSSLNSLRNMCFLEGYVGIVGSMLCDYPICRQLQAHDRYSFNNLRLQP